MGIKYSPLNDLGHLSAICLGFGKLGPSESSLNSQENRQLTESANWNDLKVPLSS